MLKLTHTVNYKLTVKSLIKKTSLYPNIILIIIVNNSQTAIILLINYCH